MNAQEIINYILLKLKNEGACCLIIENQVKYVDRVYPNIRQILFKDGSWMDLSPLDEMNEVITPEELIQAI